MTSIDRRFVRRVAGILFDGCSVDVPMATLDAYGIEPYERERARVQLAILKLYNEGYSSDLEQLVRLAKQDYRDVLAAAEYPNQLREEPHANGSTGAAEADRAQYEAWLRRMNDRLDDLTG